LLLVKLHIENPVQYFTAAQDFRLHSPHRWVCSCFTAFITQSRNNAYRK